MTNVHIRFSRFSAFYTPLLLTMSGGHLEAEGLSGTWDTVAPDRPVDRGIADGTVQVAQSATAVSFEPYSRGDVLPFRHFAVMNRHDGFFLAKRGAPAPFAWADLEGSTLVADHYFQPMALLRCALLTNGVNPDRIQFIDAGDPAAMDAAFRSGTGQFVHLQGPAPQQIELDGVGTVVASIGATTPAIGFSTLVAHPDWLASPTGHAFARAFAAARHHAQTGVSTDLARLVADFLPTASVEALDRTIAEYQRIGMWAGSLELTPSLYDTTVQFFRTYDGLAIEPPYAHVATGFPVAH